MLEGEFDGELSVVRLHLFPKLGDEFIEQRFVFRGDGEMNSDVARFFSGVSNGFGEMLSNRGAGH